ncbi:cyclic nucleotide-binding domain-containing protein [Paraburkholderia hospita]|uniref:cyclic nucleotide-binding domain-containing protein n=1 Tax=Paraburkholderia hospita TaxID=169430 RepID=UPI001374EACF
MQWLREQLTEVSIAAGEILAREGETRSHFYVVLQGEVAATKLSRGQQIPTSRFIAPSYFGAVSLLSGRPRLARSRRSPTGAWRCCRNARSANCWSARRPSAG